MCMNASMASFVRLCACSHSHTLIPVQSAGRIRTTMAQAADVWSAGVMLYELTTGLRPFIEAEEEMFTPAGHKSIMSRAGDVHYIKHNVLSQQRVGHLTPELKDLLAKMFVKEPSERITMNGVRHCLLRRMLRWLLAIHTHAREVFNDRG